MNNKKRVSQLSMDSPFYILSCNSPVYGDDYKYLSLQQIEEIQLSPTISYKTLAEIVLIDVVDKLKTNPSYDHVNFSNLSENSNDPRTLICDIRNEHKTFFLKSKFLDHFDLKASTLSEDEDLNVNDRIVSLYENDKFPPGNECVDEYLMAENDMLTDLLIECMNSRLEQVLLFRLEDESFRKMDPPFHELVKMTSISNLIPNDPSDIMETINIDLLKHGIIDTTETDIVLSKDDINNVMNMIDLVREQVQIDSNRSFNVSKKFINRLLESVFLDGSNAILYHDINSDLMIDTEEELIEVIYKFAVIYAIVRDKNVDEHIDVQAFLKDSSRKIISNSTIIRDPNITKTNYKMYTLENCPWCIKAKSLMKSNGIEFSEIEITQDNKPKMIAEIDKIKKGHRTLPFTFTENDAGKKLVIGGYEDLEKHLKNP